MRHEMLEVRRRLRGVRVSAAIKALGLRTQKGRPRKSRRSKRRR